MLENTESQEMYLTTIYALQKKNGMVRSVDVADERGYSKVSVHNAMKRLEEFGYVTFHQGKITLTKCGIERAINENKQISFLYFNYDEKHKKVYRKNGNRYTVSPAFMVWNKDNYYLLCFSKGHDDIVTYRLDKMESVKVEELERESHPEYELFNTEEYRKQVFSMFGGESQNITLLFTANILSDMFDRFGDDIRIKKADEETYSVDVTVQISKTFFAWIVGTQGKVKIKSPRKVIDEFNAFVAKIKEEY